MTTPLCTQAAPLEKILAGYPMEEPSLIQVLQDVQRAYHYLPCDVLRRVAETLRVPQAKVFSVATFYKAFSLTPEGKTVIKVCTGTACHIRGAEMLIEEIERELNIKPGGVTPDMSFSLKTVNCVGACAMAPLVIVGEKYHGKAKAAEMGTILGSGGGAHE